MASTERDAVGENCAHGAVWTSSKILTFATEFFGLRENPFSDTPDLRFLYLTDSMRKALTRLMYSIETRKGIVLLSGETGTGKTTLLMKLLELLQQQGVAGVLVSSSQLKADRVVPFLLNEFSVPGGTALEGQELARLNQWLIDRQRAGGTAVFMLDDAQNFSVEGLEAVRLLTNLETRTEKLLQVVISGGPELAEKLHQPELRQFRQRIVVRSKMHPLTPEESSVFVAERIRLAGGSGEPIFTPEAVEALHAYARGIPRLINLICEQALASAFVDQRNTVPAEIVERVARDVGMPESAPLASHSPAEAGAEIVDPREAFKDPATLNDPQRRSE